MKRLLLLKWFIISSFVCAAYNMHAVGHCRNRSKKNGLVMLARVAEGDCIGLLEQERAFAERNVKRGLKQLQRSIVLYEGIEDGDHAESATYDRDGNGYLKPRLLATVRCAVEAQRELDAACYQLRDRFEGEFLHAVMSDISYLLLYERRLMAANGKMRKSQAGLKKVSKFLERLEHGVSVMPGVPPEGLACISSDKVISEEEGHSPSAPARKKRKKRFRYR